MELDRKTSDDALRASIIRSQTTAVAEKRPPGSVLSRGQQIEQWGGLAAGGLLAFLGTYWGLTRRSLPGMAVAAAGGLLLIRGIRAYQCARGGGPCRDAGQRPDPAVENHRVDEASWESFPASDPPSFSPGSD
ncbi:MAG: hypothetical protein WD847_06080 [Pirellulales bacterium]